MDGKGSRPGEGMDGIRRRGRGRGGASASDPDAIGGDHEAGGEETPRVVKAESRPNHVEKENYGRA